MRQWQLQNKLSLDWLGGKKNSKRSDGGEFPSFCETQTKARTKLRAFLLREFIKNFFIVQIRSNTSRYVKFIS
jgi:hypothetical protein